MGGIDKSTQRVIAVVTLLFVAAWALRGYIPGVERAAERERPASSPAALAAVVVMVSVAVAIIAFAIVMRVRERRPRPASSGEFPRRRGERVRPSLRFTLIALALVIGWLLLVLILMRFGGGQDPPQQSSGTELVPDAPSTRAPRPDASPPGDQAPDTSVVTYLIPPMVVLMAMVVFGTVITSRRQKRPQHQFRVDDVDEKPAVPAAADTLARAAEVGLAEIGDLSREPREAIIACYAAMERELTRVPGAVPQDFDTPTEVLARAVERQALRADSATELVELFEEARFSPHVMTEAHRDAAVRVLQRVHAELPQATAGGAG